MSVQFPNLCLSQSVNISFTSPPLFLFHIIVVLFFVALFIVTMNPGSSVPAAFLAHQVPDSLLSVQFLTTLLNLAHSKELESYSGIGGLVPGRGANLPRGTGAGDALLFQDYFAESPV